MYTTENVVEWKVLNNLMNDYLYWQSHAIFFDSLFNFIDFLMSLLALFHSLVHSRSEEIRGGAFSIRRPRFP